MLNVSVATAEDMMKMLKTLGVAVALTAATTLAAQAETTKLRIQTHFSQETLSGQMAKKYIEDITTMSNGEIQIEMFYASSVARPRPSTLPPPASSTAT